MFNRLSINGVFGALAAALVTIPTQAQEEPRATALEEIVVTAQKRASRLEDTPLAISAVSGADIQKQQVKTLEDLASSLPGLDFSRAPNVTMLAVRGVGAIDTNVGTENRVAVHTDGVYYSRPSDAVSQLFDVGRIEYLRGPQGTLYGRNATAGAINIVTKNPSTDTDAYLMIGGGTYATVNVEGAANLPINEALSSRIAVIYNRHDGYDRDITSGRRIDDLNTYAVRGKLRYSLDPVDLVLSADYGRERDHSGAYRYVGPGSPGITPTGLLVGGRVTEFTDVATDDVGFPAVRREHYGASLNGQWQSGADDATAILGYRRSYQFISNDLDFTSAPLSQLGVSEAGKQYSGELRFHRGVEQYDLLAGVYYFHEQLDGAIATPLSLALVGGPPILAQGYWSGGMEATRAYAGFTQARWNFSRAVYAEAGARYSYERKDVAEALQFDLTRPYSPTNPLVITGSDRQSHSWSSFDPKVTLGVAPRDGVLAYVTWARGFKSGGFNLGGLQAPFQPEKITDYELGLKLTSNDRRWVGNFSAFYYDYSNMQVFKIRDVLIVLENAAKASVKGVEAEIRWATGPSLNIGASVDYLDAKYDKYETDESARLYLGTQNLAGNTLPQAPRYRARVDATYTWRLTTGNLSLRGQGSWTDRVYFSQFDRPEVAAGPHADFNGFLTYDTDQNWSFQLYGRNLTDKRYLLFANIASSLVGFPVAGSVNAPRTVGVSVRKQW